MKVFWLVFIIIRLLQKVTGFLDFLKERLLMMQLLEQNFNRDKSKHIITYFLDEYDLTKSIELITDTSNILSQKFAGKINKNMFEDKNIVNSAVF